MKVQWILALGIVLGVGIGGVHAGDETADAELYPVAPPYKQGYIDVSSLHSIHYTLHGNPKGIPVIVLHGGPGAGTYPRLTQYFDPMKFMIVLHDQRGAGQSKPSGELRENNTQNLVEDIERLRRHVGIEGPALIFGGSWGSTLALAYAETYPEKVSGMVLRGVFTGTKAEIDNIFGDGAIRHFFPQAYDRLLAALPGGKADLTPDAMLNLLMSPNELVSKKTADAWVRYSIKIGTLSAPEKKVEQDFGDWDILPGCKIDCHFMKNACFLEEGQLLNNAGKLGNIPMVIVNGRYDMLCPPVTAYNLHRKLPQSKLIIVEEAGHSEGEPGITKALVLAVKQLAAQSPDEKNRKVASVFSCPRRGAPDNSVALHPGGERLPAPVAE